MNDELVDSMIEGALKGAIDGATDGLLSPFKFMVKLIGFITETYHPSQEDLIRHYRRICGKYSIPIVDDPFVEEIIDEIIDETF